jgi:drug/metabolite transporter (DMT)-like permease
MAPVIAALLAALLFAVAAALQHRSAAAAPPAGGWRQVGALVRHTVSHPVWLAGTATELVGLGLHALALHLGPLTLVQPLLISGLVFALPLRRWLDHRPSSRAELGAAVVLVAGLILFLVTATPSSARVSPADPVPTVVVAAVLIVIVGVCLRVAARHRGARPVAYGLSAGLAFAGTAALLKATTDSLAHGPVAALTAWPLYGLIVVGGTGLLFNQMAFAAGPLRASLPAISTVDPLAALVMGVVIYDERLRTGTLAVTLEALGLILVLGAALQLSRSEPEPDRQPDAVTDRPAGG